MNDTMEYKAYNAVARFVPDHDTFHGPVVNVADTIPFAGTSVAELKRTFKESVEDYLAFCKKRREQPDKPYSGKLKLRLEPGVYQRTAITANPRSASLNGFGGDSVAAVVKRAGL